AGPPATNARLRRSVLRPTDGLPVAGLTIRLVPSRRSARRIEPLARDPKYANGPGPIAMPSGRKPSGTAIVVGNASVPCAEAAAAGASAKHTADAVSTATARRRGRIVGVLLSQRGRATRRAPPAVAPWSVGHLVEALPDSGRTATRG